MNDEIKIAIVGVGGRMGRYLLQTVYNAGCLAAAIARSGSEIIGKDAGEFVGIEHIGLMITDNLQQVIKDIDVVIDFSTCSSTLEHIQICEQSNTPIVIGTTGFNSEQLAAIQKISEKIPIVLSANYSVGVSVSLKLVELATKILKDSVDIEIIEAHHRHKIDAPSGTALMYADVIAQTLGHNLQDIAVYSREGSTDKRQQQSIGFSVVRGGDIVGEHTVMFLGNGECLEISHKAMNRTHFSNGALQAAKWIIHQKPDLYNMDDVLA
ncbi:4-hydroxy-tetrahydrodipicolinate reductase [Acinetobacter sp. Marseille-Q1618]|uniref:4-hydroxy-tetrahydrodipicolinate reductase n=1 Tax=Acinetobacter sp. Marseille-Q1618 TaxID=2697502 RepID=UPI001570FCF5|nr:4-hydroxy-tetrahydrodipicolinate reductase [Acinetobacter sp. Marseille-Q1618]